MGISPVVLVSAVVGAIAAAVTAATTRRRTRERLLADLPTAPIPRQRDVYVGRAPVPSGAAVVPLPSPEVLDAVRRLARRVVESECDRA